MAIALAVCSLATGCGDREAAEPAPAETVVFDRGSLPEAPPFVPTVVSLATLSVDDSVTPLDVATDAVGTSRSTAPWMGEPPAVRRLPPTEHITSDVESPSPIAAGDLPQVDGDELSPSTIAAQIASVESPIAAAAGAENYEPHEVPPAASIVDVRAQATDTSEASAILITGPDGSPIHPFAGDPPAEAIAPQSAPMEPPTVVAPPVPLIIERRLPPVSPSAVDPDMAASAAVPGQSSALADASTPPTELTRGDHRSDPREWEASEGPSRLPRVKLGPFSEGDGGLAGRYASGPAPAVAIPGSEELDITPQPPHRLSAPPTTSDDLSRPVRGLLLHATQSRHHVQQGFGAANRGMLYAARQEFLRALAIVAEAKDAQTGRRTHMDALSAGLTAIEEAEDIRKVSSSVAEVNLAMWVATHKTPVLKGEDVSTMLPLAIIDHYHDYAQQRLGAAVAGDPSGSMALYGLARISEYLGSENGADRVARARQSAALHEAALLAHPENHLAAHELGVILTKLGLFDKAVAMLTRSVQLHPSSTAYRNLAVASRRVGRHQQAATAERYAAQMDEHERIAGTAPSRVTWLEPEAFSRTSERTAAVPADVSRTVQEGNAPQNAGARKGRGSSETSGWWKLPIWK